MPSAVLVTTALEPRLADDARAVTIGSTAARRGSGSYGAAEAAVEAWTADLALGSGGRGITVDVVSQGVTEETGFFGGTLSEERRKKLVGQPANGRTGKPADVTGERPRHRSGHRRERGRGTGPLSPSTRLRKAPSSGSRSR